MRLGSSIRRRRSGSGGDGGGPGGRVVLYAAGALVGGLLVGWIVATRLLFPPPPPPGDLRAVPEVRGASVEEARERLAGAGLELGPVEGLRHPSADSGRIVGQSPLPEQLARPSSEVRLTVSLGAETREVPDVTRLRGDRARNLLEATGFLVVTDSVESPQPRGRVLSVEPEPGTALALPGEVSLEVSLGPPRVPMPLLLGMSEGQARDTLDALGLEVGRVDEAFRFGRDQGLVVEQAPPADTLVQQGSAVRITVGRQGGGDGAAADTSGTGRDTDPDDGGGGNKGPRQP